MSNQVEGRSEAGSQGDEEGQEDWQDRALRVERHLNVTQGALEAFVP